MSYYENQICDLLFILHRDNQNEIGDKLDVLLRSLVYDIFIKDQKSQVRITAGHLPHVQQAFSIQ